MVLVKGLCLISVHVVSVFVSKNNFSSIFGVLVVFFDLWRFDVVFCVVELVEGLCCWDVEL